ncbi:CGNR zinc finger domain-containing protein [Deinococcus cellulosilyticus]|uniref:Zinc finger CGNR domain-containing protein n=1 Tax=Deinococcus cellulosilyticus (strain DSM 18568 / NBRC 106333 / KACC 11606 / 5516J-15) TaxID=1223518 RepID=A0A511MY72_DEIC1|nr:CGNR zinc finger domain-containing protein [Deinococcus cellulosilyticus]GEM45513.1 hypothetical protein DC3_11480 [Deinococcus cellulosilyticus NBRC 106333 = KACC 11606]
MNQTFDFDANHVAVDLINTVRMKEGARWDRLEDFQDLRDWVVQSGLLDLAQTEQVKTLPESTKVLQEVKAFRDDLRAVLEGFVAGQPVPSSFLDHLNQILQQHPGHPVLKGENPPLQRSVQHDLTHPEGLLGLLAAQAADLLTLDLTGRIKKCENHLCIRYFLDTSRNNSRRWCSMSGCGNRAKAQAFYERKTRGRGAS